MNMKAIVEKNLDYIIERRRWYHQRPELSGEEKETRSQIKKDLEAIGIDDIREMEHCYGLVATIHGGQEGKTIGLRTDIDALPIVEETGLPFCATNGKMHACGHDGHISVLLGAAKSLYEVRDQLKGQVRLIIQPAEEDASGANSMVAEGAVEGLDAIYGNHIWGSLKAGKVDVTAGKRMACAHLFKIRVEGVSAHGAEPHLGIDAITVSTAIINNLQQIASRRNNPVNPLVITIGKIEAGTRFNVIASKAIMEGTVRTFLEDETIEKEMRRIIDNTAAAFGAKAEMDYFYATDAIINKDEELNRIVQAAADKVVAPEDRSSMQPLMGGEDFSKLSKGEIPYFFAFVGTNDTDHPYTNHHEKYTYNEELVLGRASALMAQVAYDFLNE